MIALWIVLAVVVVAALTVAVPSASGAAQPPGLPGHRRGPAPPAGSSSRSAGRAPGPAPRTAAPRRPRPCRRRHPPPRHPGGGRGGALRCRAAVEAEEVVEAPPVPPRFRERLGKTRGLLAGLSSGPCGAAAPVDESTWDDLEEALLRADVGVATTTALLEDLRSECRPSRSGTPTAWSTRCARTCSRR